MTPIKFKSPFLSTFNYGLSRGNQNLNHDNLEVRETDSTYHFELKMSGYIKSDFNCYIKEEALVVTTERDQSKAETTSRHAYCYPSSYFKKRFRLPKNILKDKINFDYKNGVLSVDVFKLVSV
ncbi:MAG: Hsp20/alpha crystallin family protein [Flavobacteriaceae bacterium]